MHMYNLYIIIAMIFAHVGFLNVYGNQCPMEGDNKLIITTTNTHLYLFFECEHCDNNESFTTAPSLMPGKYLGISKFKEGPLGIILAITGCLTGMIDQDLPGAIVFENSNSINEYFFDEDQKIKTFKLSNQQAQAVLLFLKESFQREKEEKLKYNLQKYNCINFGADAYNAAGLQQIEGEFYERFLVKGDYNPSNPNNTIIDTFIHEVNEKSKWSILFNWLIGNIDW